MIQSVDRALNILMTVSDMRGEPVTLGIIAKRTGIHASTCAHLVQTLCEKGFLSQVSRSSGYVLGAYAYYLTRYKAFHKELVETCTPALKWIQKRTGHTALLAILVDGEKFVISYAEDSKNQLHERGELFRGNLYNSATGRAMLSTMSRTELNNLAQKIGLPKEEDWPGVNSLPALEKELRTLTDQKIVCIEDSSNGQYDSFYGISLRAPRLGNCAVGLHVRQESAPMEEERLQTEKVLLAGAREINRRLRFERDLI